MGWHEVTEDPRCALSVLFEAENQKLTSGKQNMMYYSHLLK